MDNKNEINDVIVLKFADSKVPVFKEERNKDYIKYGDKNEYPEYLNMLFNKSGKHNAILTGKANYIFGNGFETGDFTINRLGESLNDIAKKSILDIVIFGGFRWEIIWGKGGNIVEVYHVDFMTLRKGKDGGFMYKESWKDLRCEAEIIQGFSLQNKIGSQIYEYNEYRPGFRYYPLPDYIGCNNYIETDIEISKYYLSAIKNGMMPSKMIQFYIGDPTNDKKAEIEKRWKDKFSGSENAGKFVLVFNNSKDKQVDIQDLSATDLDKHFQELNKTCQQEVFSGHKVTNPMLFGIMEAGKLGGTSELKVSYSIFQNTYAKLKAKDFCREVKNVLQYSIFPGEFELRESDPIGLQLPDSLLASAITPDEARESLGLPVFEKVEDSQAVRTLNAISGVSPLVATKILDNLTKNEIRSLASLSPIENGDYIPTTEGIKPTSNDTQTLDSEELSIPTNDAIRSLTAKQHQQLMRIIRQYSKGQLTEPAARTLIKTGLGLNDDDINNLLGIEPAAKFDSMDETINVFEQFGESKIDYEILKSKKVLFENDDEAADDEIITMQDIFKTSDFTLLESRILELIKKDVRITPEVISTIIKIPVENVRTIITRLTEKGVLESVIEKIGVDEVIKRTIPERVFIPPVKISGKVPSSISIKYSYEGPQDNRNRAFCAKLLDLDRLYTRADIEKITQRLGYSVWDRRGGFWNKGNGVISESCRHSWKSNLVIKKGI